jgi:hypothetical protein
MPEIATLMDKNVKTVRCEHISENGWSKHNVLLGEAFFIFCPSCWAVIKSAVIDGLVERFAKAIPK